MSWDSIAAQTPGYINCSQKSRNRHSPETTSGPRVIKAQGAPRPVCGTAVNRRLATGTAGFGKTGESALNKAAFPFYDYRAIDANQIGRLLLAVPLGAGEDNARPSDFSLGCLGSFDHGLKFPELGGIKR
jgi:hypothetical protein